MTDVDAEIEVDPAIIETARRGLRSADKNIRKQSAAMLDHHADASCIADLVNALGDPSPDVRRHALHSLGCQACKPSPLQADIVIHLIDLAKSDPSIRVRRTAAHMLGNQAPDARAAAALEEIVTNTIDRKLRFNAQWALSQQVQTPSRCIRGDTSGTGDCPRAGRGEGTSPQSAYAPLPCPLPAYRERE